MKLTDFIKREFSFITGNYRILVVSWMIMDIAMEMPQPNFQYYVNDVLHGPPMALGLIGLANFFAMAVVAFPGGYLADKYGRRWLITTMTFAIALSFLFFAFAPTWHFVLLGSVIGSICLIYQPALFALVQDSLPSERRGIGISIIQLIHGTFNTPGPVIAGLLLLNLGLEWSMRVIYLTMTALFLVAAAWRLRLKETVTNDEPIRLRYLLSSYPNAVKESFGVWKAVPRTVLWLFSVRTLVMFGMALTNVINALYAREVLGIPKEQWWLVFIPLLLTMVIASIPIGKLVDTVGRKTPLAAGLSLLGCGTIIFAVGDFLMVLISMCLFGLAHMLVMSSAMALSTDLTQPRNRGKIVGFNNFVGYIVMGLGMLLGGYLFEYSMPQSPFIINLVVTLVALLIVAILVKEPVKETSVAPGAARPNP